MFRKKSIIGLVLIFTLIAPYFARADVFLDVSSAHPNFQAITALHEQGIIEGYADNTFRPNQAVNRAEALKIILLGSAIFVPEIKDQEIFPDVLPNVWYGKYVAKAKNLQIVKGDDYTGLFRPGDTVNLAEALKILINANDIPVKTPSKEPFADVPQDAWFAPYFEYARLVKLLDASASDFVEPDTPINRGMLAELMYRLSQKPKVDGYGKASFYGEQFHGKNTASGDVFDASGLTAAHRTYPFNTWLKVTNTENGQSVIVRVNDRGPYGDSDRIIDLSKAAFQAIAPLSRGVINVTLQVVEGPDDTGEAVLTIPKIIAEDEEKEEAIECPEKSPVNYAATDFFNAISLEKEIPNQLIEGEILRLSGQIDTGASAVTAFFKDEKGDQIAFSAPVASGKFVAVVPFSTAGNYELGLIPGASGQSTVHSLKVLPKTCLKEKESIALAPPAKPEALLEKQGGKLQWEKGAYTIFKLSFIQGGQSKSYFIQGANQWQPLYSDFKNFLEGSATIELRGGVLNEKSLAATENLEWSPPASLKLNLTMHHEYQVNETQVSILSAPDLSQTGSTLEITLNPKVGLRSSAAVILPSGLVKTITLTGGAIGPITDKNGVSIFPPGSGPLKFKYTPDTQGLHFIEINDAEGLAAINIPVYAKNTFPILPNPNERTVRKVTDLGNDLGSLKVKFLDLVNEDRLNHQIPSLVLDTALGQLAQHRADDMVKNNYFGHWDKEGNSINELRKNYAITQVVAENLAKDLTLELAQYGLMRSAVHRENILGKDWTRVGFGIAKNPDGSYMFVQLFSGDPLSLSDPEALRREILNAINESRSVKFAAQNDLTALAQQWTEKMVTEDFFDFSDKQGASLFDTIEAAGIRTKVGVYLGGNSSFSGLLDQVRGNAALKELSWKNIGIGLKQDAIGIVKITLIYSE